MDGFPFMALEELKCFELELWKRAIHRMINVMSVFWMFYFKPGVDLKKGLTQLASSTYRQTPAYPVWGSTAVWAAVQSTVCTALGGKIQVIPWMLEGLAGPDHGECQANDLFNRRSRINHYHRYSLLKLMGKKSNNVTWASVSAVDYNSTICHLIHKNDTALR